MRTDAARHRPVAGDSPGVEGIKVLARAYQRLIWDRHRSALRLRRVLREYFPGALAAFADLSAPDTLELLARAPEPQAAARLSKAQITAALKRARRCHIADKTAAIQATLRARQLAQPPELAAAYAAAVVALTKVITAFSEQITVLEQQVSASFRQHPSAGIYLSQPGLGPRLAARLLGEFGDDPHRYASAKGRKNYASTSPITRASGKKKTIMARYARTAWIAAGRHPARLPENRRLLRRAHRLGTPLRHTRTSRRLIVLLPFPAPPPAAAPGPPERSQGQGRPQAARRAALTLASTGTHSHSRRAGTSGP